VLGTGLAPAEEPARDLTSLSLEELAALEVVTVSKKPEKLAAVPAAVTVITGEELRRAGVRRLSEALRLVPGVHVARINASQTAVGIRGGTSRLSKSMLVLIDGRSVYTPLFAGVYWEAQDTLLADIDRIEVIRGPGGSLWGANAVHGVVNVITKAADRTQGGYAEAVAGSEHRSVAARHGGRAGDTGSYRAYAKYFAQDAAYHTDGGDWDDWSMGQAGFRSDWGTPQIGDGFTLQGDVYDGRTGARTTLTALEPPFSRTVERDIDLTGGNVLGRWTRRTEGGSDLAVQGYWDRTEREEASFAEDRDTFDLDVQHRIRLAARHELVYGAGYRRSVGTVRGVPTVSFEPARRADELWSAFAQYDVSLVPDRLHLVLGSKLEHDDYSGFEAQPGVRLLWTPDGGGGRQVMWVAISRPVRTPSRIEHDFRTTALASEAPLVFARLSGNRQFETERYLVYEAGYRLQATARVWIDVAAFHSRARNLASLEAGPAFFEEQPPPDHLVIPLTFENRLRGFFRGVEISADAVPMPWWRLYGAYSWLDIDLEPRSGSTDTSARAVEQSSPEHQVLLRSSMSLSESVDFDLAYRFVDRLPEQDVAAHGALDLRLAWRPSTRWELAAVGRSVLNDRHEEFGGGVEVERAVELELVRRW
jgi:iron complex outermembrane receptor protein